MVSNCATACDLHFVDLMAGPEMDIDVAPTTTGEPTWAPSPTSEDPGTDQLCIEDIKYPAAEPEPGLGHHPVTKAKADLCRVPCQIPNCKKMLLKQPTKSGPE